MCSKPFNICSFAHTVIVTLVHNNICRARQQEGWNTLDPGRSAWESLHCPLGCKTVSTGQKNREENRQGNLIGKLSVISIE